MKNDYHGGVTLEYLKQLKISAQEVAEHLLADESTIHEGNLVSECAFHLKIYSDGEKRPIASSWYCKNKSCPICQWRKSLQYCTKMRQLLDDTPQLLNAKWVCLKLTVRDCPVEKLRAAVSRMDRACQTLANRQLWKKNVHGGIRFLEVVDRNQEAGLVTPYFNCLLLVSQSMSERGNSTLERDWAVEWQQALGAKCSPMVEARKITGIEEAIRSQIISYIRNSMIPRETPHDRSWFQTKTHQMRSLRLVEPFGQILTLFLALDTKGPFGNMEENEDIRRSNELLVHTWDGQSHKYLPSRLKSSRVNCNNNQVS